MWRQSAHEGEALRLPACAGASVRLRLSLRDRLLGALRWTLGLAGAVVVLWLGTAFLAAAPAAAAVAVPVVAAQQGLLKGGVIRPAGSGGDGDSDSGSGGSDSSNGGSEKKSDKKSEKKSDGKSDEKDSEKKSEKKDSDGEGSKKKSDKKKSDKQKDGKKDSDEKESKEKAAGKKKSEKESDEKSEKKDAERKAAAKKEPDDVDESGDADSGKTEKAKAQRQREGSDDDVGRADRDRDRNDSESDDADSDDPDADTDRDTAEDRRPSVNERSAKDGPASEDADTEARDGAAAGTEKKGSEKKDSDRTTTEREPDAADDGARAARLEAADRDADDDARERTREAGREDDADERGIDGRDEDGAKASDDQQDEPSRRGRVAAGNALERIGDADRADDADDQDEADRDGVSRLAKVADVEQGDRGADGDDRESAEKAVRAAIDRLDRDEKDSDDGDDRTPGSARDRDDEDTSEGARELVRDALRSVSDDADISEDDVERVVETAAAELDRDSGDVDQLRGTADASEDDEQSCDGGKDCANSASERQRMSLLSERGPPDEDSARKSDDDDDRDEDDSAERTEQVLEDRIEVDESKEALEKERGELAAGKTTKADYTKKAGKHAELEKRAAEHRAEASDDDVELVDEVVDGHRELDERENALDAEEKELASGKGDRKKHEKNVEDFEERRDEVYEATDELMDATDREVRTVSEADLDGEGAAAGCDSDGAFTGCGSASESADGERDSERRLCVSGVSSGCGASSESGGSKAEASCDGSGCRSTASRRGVDGKSTSASAKCTGDCDLNSRADRDGSEASCDTAGGSCDSRSRGSGADEPEVRKAAEDDGGRVGGGGAAVCTGSCRTSSSVDVDADVDETVVADAEVDCEGGCSGAASTTADAGTDDAGTGGAEQADGENGGRATDAVTAGKAGCTVSGGDCAARSTAGDGAADAVVEVDCAAACEGKGTAVTSGTTGAERTSNGAASCVARGGACGSSSETRVDDAGGTGGDRSAFSTASASVDCDDSQPCSGEAGAKTDGEVTATPTAAGGAAPVRRTSAASTCAATDGGCVSESASHVSDAAAGPAPRSRQWREAPGRMVSSAGRELSAGSAAGARVDCAAATCTGHGWNTTSGAASGDVVGVRSSTGAASCTAHGAGGSCASQTDTTVADRAPGSDPAAVSGPVSVSHASAFVECAGGIGECGGTSASSTSARDTGVSPHARGTSATAECTVTGGGCSGETSSAASSAPDFAMIDPNTGRPAAGPSSASSSSASLVCGSGTTCSGSVRTGTTAWDGAVANGAPRISQGSASCTGATGGCEVRSVSNASSGPGAALALAGDGRLVNAARLPAGPSAASAAGAAMTCAGAAPCTGTVRSAATATDPVVSPNPRGSHSEGSCEGVSGGGCQAVTNSGASSGPDANVIAPLVAERSTANATVTSGTTGEQPPAEQPEEGQQAATLPGPTAPGSSANSGAPTVPGASSWTTASATLDCAAGIACSGTARTSAAGSDGPAASSGANGARGPPAGGSATSASCTGSRSGCAAQTSSTAASGQVVADIVAEEQNAIVEQLADQAAQATLVAAYAARIAAQAGATPEQKKAAADAAAAAQLAGKAVAQAAEVARKPVTGVPDAVSESSAAARCAGQGCTASTTGATSGARGTSTTNGTCTAAAAGCMATSDASASVDRDPHHAGAQGVPGSGQSGSRLSCPEAGCTGTVSGSASAHAASGRITATATANCAVTSGCQADVSASVGTGSVDVTAGCAGTGCQTRTSGAAHAAWPGGHSRADARSACTAGGNGECASSAQVAANADYVLAGAECAGTRGSRCSHSWSVTASDHAAHPSGSWARADARDSGSGAAGAGGGWVYAQADAGDGYAIAGAGCSDQARCTKSYAAHIEFGISWGQQQTYEQDGGIWNARRLGDCTGSRGSGCGLFRGGNNVQCTGDCSNFRQTLSNPRFTLLAPAGWKIEAAEAAHPIAKLDPVTQRKAEQTGRDLRVYDRTKTRDVPDNQIVKALRHTENADRRMDAEADQTAATAREQAVANGASAAQAEKVAQNYRASYFDAVASTAVDPRGNVPAVVAQGRAGAMGELKAAVDHKRRFDALQAAGDRAAEAFEAKYTAAQSADRDAHTVASTAGAANASMQSALQLAGEAAALGRDFALRHGAAARQADTSGRLFRNDYLDVVNAAPARGRLRVQAAQNHSTITRAAEDVWRGAGIGLNRPDVPDNHLRPILDHEEAEAAAIVAAGDQRAGDLAYQEALLGGMSVGAAENARSTAVEEYRTDLGLEISKIGVETFGTAVAPSYVIDRAGGTGVIGPGTTEVLAHPALADGQVDGGEGDRFADAVAAAVAASTGPADPLADLAPYIPYDPMTRHGDRRQELLSDPRVVDALVPGGTAEEALDELTSRQGYLAFARGQQESVRSMVGDFNDFVGDYDAKIAAARERRGVSPDEALLLDIQHGQILAAQAQLNSEILESRADVRAKTRALVPVDIAIAEASGNAAAADNLRAAAATLDKIQAIEVAVPERAGADVLNRASGLVIDLGTMGDLGYANVRDSLLTSRPAGDMRLPSSGAPDAQLAAMAAIALPGFGERISDNRENRVRQVFEAQNRDERARLAAHYTSVEFERVLAGDMERLVGLYFPASPNETPGQKAKRHEDFMLLVENGQVEDFERVTRFLSPRDEEILENANPDAGIRFYLRLGEKAAGLADSTASGIEEKLGVTTKDTVFGNAIRDVGAVVGYAPVGMIRMGDWAVRSAQYYAGVQRAAFDPTGPHFDATTEARIEPRPGDTWDQSFTRRDPFLGNMFVTPTANMGRRWGPAIFQGDYDKVINGDRSTGLMGYRDHPVLTFLEDITPFSVIGGAASMGLRIPAMAATSAARAAARAATVARFGARHSVMLAESGVKKVRIHGTDVELDSLRPSERAAVAAQDDQVVSALEHLARNRVGRPDGATDYFGSQLYRIQNLDHAADVTARRAARLARHNSLAGTPGRPVDSVPDLLSADGSVRWSVNALTQAERRDVDLERQVGDALSGFRVPPEQLREPSPSAGAPPGIGERFGAGRDHPSDRYERPPPSGVDAPDSRGVADDDQNPDEADLATTVATSGPEYQRIREADFEGLVERNKGLRKEGAEQVRAMNGGADPDLDDVRRPNKRALATLRYRADDGQIIDLHGYSGGPGPWAPSNATPEAPHWRWRLFETKEAAPYDPDSPTLRGNDPWSRDKDSEAVLLEELARRQLEAASGLSRREVDAAIFKAVRAVGKDVEFRRKEYADGAEGEAERARDRVEKTIEILNRNARRNAERNGTDYTPFTVNDINGDVRLVVDLPSGRAHPLDAQVCDSCTDVLYSYRFAFPGVGGRFEVRNLAQERLEG